VTASYLLAQLSDSHLRAGAEGDAAAAGLTAAIDRVLALDRLPDAVLVSGDLVDSGGADEYTRVRELLARLPMPVRVMIGNHDDRAELCATFDLPAPDGFVQYVDQLGPLRLVCCDTIKPGVDDGAYGPERLAWLRDALAADRETPTIVALHHPPLPIGIAGLDALGLPLADRRALATLLAEHDQIQRVVAGHVHRSVVGELGGRPLVTCPSTYLQARLDLRAEGDIELRSEPPGFLVHAWIDGQLVSHVQPLG
jgi:3',5'-cyclic AMP phosphodiesterase CpdA